jgi:hypothetical protein
MSKRPDPPPTYAFRNGLHTFTFPDQTALEITPPRRDSLGRLWAEVVAKGGNDRLFNRGRIDLLSLKDRQQFHLMAAMRNGSIDWQARLLLASHYLGSAKDQQTDGASDEPPPPPTAAVEPFPLDVLPIPLRRFAEEVSKALPCPPDFIGVLMLPVLGTAIGTSRVLEVKPGWHEGCRIWSALVADPGSKKSPALDLVMLPRYEQQHQFKESYLKAKDKYDQDHIQYEIELAEWRRHLSRGEAKREMKPVEPIKPAMSQIFTTDATLEALASLLQHNPRGLAFVRDELAGWALAMNQYKGGKRADRQSWLSFWNGAPVIVNRKTQDEPIVLENPFVCVTGALPPDVLSDLADERGREDGFIHRILFGFPDPLAMQWSEASVSEMAIMDYCKVFRALVDLKGNSPNLPGVISFTPKGKKTFVDFANDLYGHLADPLLPANLRGPLSKLEGYCARLALILHLCRYVCQEVRHENVDERSVLGAAALVHYFQCHARRVYAYLQATPEDKQVMQALKWIEKQGGQVTAREVLHHHVAGVKTADDAQYLLERLEKRGYGAVTEGAKNSVKFELTTRRDRRQVASNTNGSGPEVSP